MAHNLATIDDAVAMFCVGDKQSAWHQLGQRAFNTVTWQEAMRLAKLDWEVKKQRLFSRDMAGKVFEIPDVRSIFRHDGNGKPGAYLGTVGKDYEPIQNVQAFDFVDSILQAENGAHYESAGALGNGERIWVLARIPDADIRIAGTDDFSMSYLMVATSHDGSMSYTSKLTTTRIVCQNTLNVALGERANSVLKIKHTKDAKQRLERAKGLIQGITTTAKEVENRLNLLASRKMTKESMKAVLDRLFPATVEVDGGKARSTKQSNVAMKVLELFESNDNNAIPEIRGTAYNLFNAVTEYTDHFRNARITEGREGYSVERARAENAMFGTGDAFKNEAMVAVLEETKDAPAAAQGAASNGQKVDWGKALGISNLE